MQRTFRVTQRLLQALVGRRIPIVPMDVLEVRRQCGERRLVDAAVLCQAVPRALEEPVQRLALAGHTDHRYVQIAAPGHRLQRRKDLLERQIAGGAEEHQRVGTGYGHSFARFMPCAGG